MEQLTVFKQRFDPLFTEYLAMKMADLPSHIPLLAEMGSHLITLAHGGKRLRPFVAFIAGKETIATLHESTLLHLLYSIELYHLYALIHDDIIDRADTRHGVPCMHMRYGNAQAMLWGDLCLSWAHECMNLIHTPANDTSYTTLLFAALSQETIVGQILDVALARNTLPTTEAILDRMIDLKTARYTFIYPLFLGRALIDDIQPADAPALVRFGRAIGHAFQRLDDLADIFWSEEKLGKAPGIDFRNGVPNHLSVYVQEKGDVSERSTCSMLFGNRDAAIDTIRALLISTGAYAHEKESIKKLIADAGTALENTSCSEAWQPCIAMLEEKLETL